MAFGGINLVFPGAQPMPEREERWRRYVYEVAIGKRPASEKLRDRMWRALDIATTPD